MTFEHREQRFLLFCYETYYPGGGWNDFKGAFHSVERAVEVAKQAGNDNWEVVDYEKLSVVASGDCGLYER